MKMDQINALLEPYNEINQDFTPVQGVGKTLFPSDFIFPRLAMHKGNRKSSEVSFYS